MNSGNNLKILPYKKEDIGDIARLEQVCFSTPWSQQALTAELDNPNAHFLTAFEGEKPAGYLGLYDVAGECYITNIAVFPEFRRMGIADALLKRCECDAVERGCVFISLEVRQSNLPAVKLYEKNGYIIAGTRKNFYSAPTEDAYIMTKTLRTDLN